MRRTLKKAQACAYASGFKWPATRSRRRRVATPEKAPRLKKISRLAEEVSNSRVFDSSGLARTVKQADHTALRLGYGRVMEREITVQVWGKSAQVTVYQKSKSVWIATGEYLGQHVQVQGRSAGSAAKLWAETARYRTN